MMADPNTTGTVLGYRWRSSKILVISCITIALFSDTFLYSFIVPILTHILQKRLNAPFAHIQLYTSAALAIYGFVAMIASPIIGHFADKRPNRKTPLLLSLLVCLLATAMISCAHNLWIFFLGRALQAVAASAIWVIGLATIADRIEEEDVGKVIGVVMSFTMAGPIAGPMVSGLMFDTLGYWPTWTVPFLVLTIDLVTRLLMVEESKETIPDPQNGVSRFFLGGEQTESCVLFSGSRHTYQTISKDAMTQDQAEDITSFRFYREICSDESVVVSLIVSIVSMFINASLDATLPLHVHEVFGWGTSAPALMFFCLQISSLIMTPLSGWLFDRIGPKYPTTVSLIVLIPLLWVLGVPGSGQYQWVDTNTRGQSIYISAIAGIGATAPFIGSIGNLKLTAFVKGRQKEDPNIFGPHGGFARAYALNDVLTTIAMTAGPIMSGALHGTVGYFYMNLVFGFAFIPLPFLSFRFLGGKQARKVNAPPDSDELRDHNIE